MYQWHAGPLHKSDLVPLFNMSLGCNQWSKSNKNQQKQNIDYLTYIIYQNYDEPPIINLCQSFRFEGCTYLAPDRSFIQSLNFASIIYFTSDISTSVSLKCKIHTITTYLLVWFPSNFGWEVLLKHVCFGFFSNYFRWNFSLARLCQ